MTTPHRNLAAMAGVPVAAGLAGLAAVRRRRPFHPVGVALTGTWTAADDLLPPLAPSRPWPVVVRLSKGAGLPGALPDVLGLAIRVVDVDGLGGHQDLLLSSTGGSGWTQHLLRPTADHGHAHFSTLTPYRTPIGRGVIWATARLEDGSQPRTLDEAVDRAVDGILHYDVGVDADGRSHLLGTVRLHEQLGDEENEAFRFDLDHNGAALEPAGIFDGIRRMTYAATQWIRPTPASDDEATEDAVAQEAGVQP